MSIQRYGMKTAWRTEELTPHKRGKLVLYTDHVADKAAEVARLQERVRVLERLLEAREAVLGENVNGWEMDSRIIEAGPYRQAALAQPQPCQTCGGCGELVDGSGLFEGRGPTTEPCPDCQPQQKEGE